MGVATLNDPKLDSFSLQYSHLSASFSLSATRGVLAMKIGDEEEEENEEDEEVAVVYMNK